MIRFFFIAIVVCCFFQCTKKIDYYHGYVYETKNKPAVGLTIKGDLADISTKTDKNGYFKIEDLNLVNIYIYI